MLYSILRAVSWVFTHIVCRYRVSGREHVPMKGSLLIVANHLSWYDPFLMGVILPRRVWFFTKSEIFRWPIVGFLCLLTGQIPVNRGERDRAALEKGLTYLREGKTLMIFPEGTVERQEQMIHAHTGTAMLAVRTGATVLPIAHCGTRRVLRSLRNLVSECIRTDRQTIYSGTATRSFPQSRITTYYRRNDDTHC